MKIKSVLHSFSIKNIFYDKMVVKLFLFSCDDIFPILSLFKHLVNPLSYASYKNTFVSKCF